MTGQDQQIAEQNALILRYESLIAELKRALYGKKSEKLTQDERNLGAEDLEVALSEAEASSEAATQSCDKEKKAKPRKAPERNIGNLPEDLPRIEQVIEPDSVECPCGCGAMHKIGEDRSERLDIVPAQLRVIVTVRPKYACRSCAGGVKQAPGPSWLIEGGLPTEAAIAHVLVSKYADHLPLYRQSQILVRSGIDIHRATLAGWVGKAAFHLKPVVERLAEHLKSSTKLFMDETTVPVLDPGEGKTKTGYFWTLARDDRSWRGDAPPGVVYFYAPGRAGENAEKFLKGFNGVLQLDGYQGYNRLMRPTRKGGSPIRAAYCWSHARRKLKEVFDRDKSGIAAEGLRRIAEFYAIETEIRGLPPEQRLSARQTQTAPLVAEFGTWLQEQRLQVSKKSRLGEKLNYIHKHWDGLQVFLSDGRVEIDSNNVENLQRPIALGRKNALFAGHDEGGASWGRIASLIQTAKLNGVEPNAYLTSTLQKIAAGHPQSRIDELLPWNFQKSS
ncbi:IS66 family transposase [Ruegeria sp.]|uniref:IS66 family transposase n=1 Tax=Ruegeria sp. TaxID=1879320 RepID=UPI003AFF930F